MSPYMSPTSPQIKLCDFGFACFCGATGRVRTLCGTPLYTLTLNP